MAFPTITTQRPVTHLDFFLGRSRGPGRQEYLEGVLYDLPSVSQTHQLILDNLLQALRPQLKYTPCELVQEAIVGNGQTLEYTPPGRFSHATRGVFALPDLVLTGGPCDFFQPSTSVIRNPGYGTVALLPMPERLSKDTRSRLLEMTPEQIRTAPAEALADVKTLQDLKGTDFTPEQKKAIILRLRERLREQADRVGLPTGRTRAPGLPPGRWALQP
jgi:hypothetical protein